MVRIPTLICGLVLAVGLSAASPSSANSQQQQNGGSGEATSNAQPPPAIHEPQPAEVTDGGCDKSQDNRKSDLCAQWKAADAAYDSAVWTARTYHLGIAGLVVGFLTLLAAGMAAKYARDAAIHTRRSADSADRMAEEAANATQAARESIQISQTHGKLQMRAYLGVQAYRVEFQSVPVDTNDIIMQIIVGIRVRNSGTSPAHNVKAGGRFKQIGWPFVLEDEPALPNDGQALHVVAAGDTVEDIRLTQSVRLKIDELSTGTTRFYIGVRIDYEDVFGDPHTSEYHATARPDSLAPFMSHHGPGSADQVFWEVIPGSAVAT